MTQVKTMQMNMAMMCGMMMDMCCLYAINFISNLQGQERA